ncbi:hypothetical protein [Spiroplasma endosymbiont of Tricholauxania praeusta]|uniref:hypothetical protein n=1 Tax=Spiroplasma endosymbiont of Tricholauxania praeusta TaxID=3066296 RepID=UPI0030CFC259
MPSEISTKRKVIAGVTITTGTLTTTAGITTACVAAAPMTGGASLLPVAIGTIAVGTTLIAGGMATTTNFGRKESRINKFLRTNPTIPTVRVSKENVNPNDIKESRFNEFLRLSGFVSTKKVSKANITPDYIKVSNELANSSKEPVMRTRSLTVTSI